jgi:hypothetical protein
MLVCSVNYLFIKQDIYSYIRSMYCAQTINTTTTTTSTATITTTITTTTTTTTTTHTTTTTTTTTYPPFRPWPSQNPPHAGYPSRTQNSEKS